MRKNSIGNDIVALNQINAARTRQPKFYLKFITQAEADLYTKSNLSAVPFEHFIWLCWSVKESAFKFLKRINADAVFSFKNIQIKQIEIGVNTAILNFNNKTEGNCLKKDDCFNCTVFTNSVLVHSRSYITKQFIYTVAANTKEFSKIFWGIKEIKSSDYNAQSANVRAFASEKLKEILNINRLEILKNETGYPYLNQYKSIPLSFTHHGNFVAYSFLLNNNYIEIEQS